MYTTAKEVFDTALPARFRADAVLGEKVTYHFAVTGGGSYGVKIENGALSIEGPHFNGPADLILSITEQDFLDLVNGKEGIQLLFMTGKLRVDGDLPTAMKLVKFFPA